MIGEARQFEVDKYVKAYQTPSYRMGRARMNAARQHLTELPIRGSLLDVGCGRGEMLDIANEVGFKANGIDPATFEMRDDISSGIATHLPCLDDSYDVVSTFDMMEHLLHSDHVPALEEMKRVAKYFVVIAAADFPHEPYHISHMPNDQWEALFKTVFDNVERLPQYKSISRTWLCRL